MDGTRTTYSAKRFENSSRLFFRSGMVTEIKDHRDEQNLPGPPLPPRTWLADLGWALQQKKQEDDSMDYVKEGVKVQNFPQNTRAEYAFRTQIWHKPNVQISPPRLDQNSVEEIHQRPITNKRRRNQG
jgi:hypothetical protein